MTNKRYLWVFICVSVLSLLVTADLRARDFVRHITLTGSFPAEEQVLSPAEVKEVRLFFSGAPLLRGASVRIVTSSRSLVRSGPPAVDAKEPNQLFVKVDQPLAPGSYVIQWRCIASDGHVMRGDFRFRVEA